jgi:intein-encoded DNA endonuclease-like protein
MTKKVNVEFFDQWSEQMAYVLGFIYADGCLSLNKGKYPMLIFGSTDLEVIETLKHVMESEHKINVRTSAVRSPYYSLVICNTHMGNRLMELGVTVAKTKTKTFPQIPEPYVTHFIRGYFDGNGHFTSELHKGVKTRLVSGFTTGSEQFAQGLRDKLFQLGLREATVSLVQRNRTGLVEGATSYYQMRYYVHDTKRLYELMYTDATIYMKRKKEFYDSIKQRVG